MKIANDLQRIYDEIQTYQPPDTLGASSSGFFSKLFKPKPKLDQSLRLKGLYIYGSVGGGKTLLMDMFFECCTQVNDLDFQKYLIHLIYNFPTSTSMLLIIFRLQKRSAHISIHS